MSIEEQLREYRATLDRATEAAAVPDEVRVAPPVRIRPARTLVFATVAVAAAVAVAFAAVGITHDRSTRPAGTGSSPSIATTVPTSIAPASRTVVPDVIGMQRVRAASTLRHFGFSVVQTAAKTCVAPPGTVVHSDPAPGAHVFEAITVTVVVCPQPVVAATITVPVVVCPTETGIPFSASDPHPPASFTIANPGFTSPKLSGYSDKRGRLRAVAPAGWNCRALDATDGGVAIGITPPGATPRQSWDYGGKVIQPPTDGVFLYSDPTCGGCVFDDVCAIVPGTANSFPGLPCPAQPAGQTSTTLGQNFYGIDDPPGALGPDAAHSMLRYIPKTATTDAGDLRVTCILAPSQRGQCNVFFSAFNALNQ